MVSGRKDLILGNCALILGIIGLSVILKEFRRHDTCRSIGIDPISGSIVTPSDQRGAVGRIIPAQIIVTAVAVAARLQLYAIIVTKNIAVSLDQIDLAVDRPFARKGSGQKAVFIHAQIRPSCGVLPPAGLPRGNDLFPAVVSLKIPFIADIPAAAAVVIVAGKPAKSVQRVVFLKAGSVAEEQDIVGALKAPHS